MSKKKIGLIYSSLKNLIEEIFDKKNLNQRENFKKIENNFSSIKVDSSNYLSELCLLGEKYGTDKSVFNKASKHQHSYTPIYNILLNHFKNKDINIAELGVAESASLKMFREYFKNANIYIFDNDNQLIEKSKKLQLNKVNYFQLDVENKTNIKNLFEKNNILYDLIIDDTSHLFEHQINIIEETYKFLNKDGFLIIEDIFVKKKNYREELYYERLKHLKNEFSEIFFCECKHNYNYSGFWNNSKLLVFKR